MPINYGGAEGVWKTSIWPQRGRKTHKLEKPKTNQDRPQDQPGRKQRFGRSVTPSFDMGLNRAFRRSVALTFEKTEVWPQSGATFYAL